MFLCLCEFHIWKLIPISLFRVTVRKFFLFYKQKPLEYNELQRLHTSYTIPAYSLTCVFDDFLRVSTEYAARRIFAENDVLSIEKHFNRITVINSECAAHLDGENDSSELSALKALRGFRPLHELFMAGAFNMRTLYFSQLDCFICSRSNRQEMPGGAGRLRAA